MIDKILQELPENYKTKNTHPKKTYILHANECSQLAESLVHLYYPEDDELLRFIRSLSFLHDVGKLLLNWDLVKEANPPHGLEGVEWILKREKLRFIVPFSDMLIYAILTHHLPLYPQVKLKDVIEFAERRYRNRSFNQYEKSKKFCQVLKNLDSLPRESIIKLVDAIGMFKLADIISAMGLDKGKVILQYTQQVPKRDAIRKKMKSKGKSRSKPSFDEQKFHLQSEIAEINRPNVAVAAPTGWGKTTLSLLRASYLNRTKIFYVLPTITAIREFYEDLTEIFGRSNIGEYFYFVDVDLLRAGMLEDESHPLDMYRYFVPKLIVTTMDQILLTALQVGRYHVKRFNFKNALFIVDEFHLLTPQMIAALRVFCHDFQAFYNFYWLLMSATSSPLYMKMLSETMTDLKICILENEYRKLKRHKIKFMDQNLLEFIKDRSDLFKEKRVLVIANRVYEAQNAFNELTSTLDGKKIILLHSRFTYHDRSEKEKEINRADILVSTQVAEVSLDISFETLVTELAPIPSLIQRFGRVNRYGSEPSDVNVYICKASTHKPYTQIEMDLAKENIGQLMEGLEKAGEAAYLDERFWEFETLLEEDIRIHEKKLRDKLATMGFHSFTPEAEKSVLEYLGREENLMAIPKSSESALCSLLDKIRSTRAFDEKRKLYAKLKEHFMPIPRWITKGKFAEWNEFLKCYVVSNYDTKIGLIIPCLT